MALAFDGTNDQVDFTDIAALDTPTAFTLSLWISGYNESAQATNDGIFSKSAVVATSGFCHFANNAGVGFRFFIGATGYNKTVGIPDTDAHMLTIVYDGAGSANADRLKMYLDAVEQTATSYTGTVPATATDSGVAPLRVGRAGSDQGYAAMTAGHFKVWSAALSQSEILREMYSYAPVRTSNLLVWAPMDTGTAVATDYSGNGFNGTITEATAANAFPQVRYGNRVLSPTRDRRVTRRSDYDSFRRLGPFVPNYWRGL